MRGSTVDAAIEDFLRSKGRPVGPVSTQLFIQTLAKAFLDAQAKRHHADYDLNTPLSEKDAHLLYERVERGQLQRGEPRRL